MVQQSIIDSVKDYLNRLSQTGFEINFGVIFGSYAKGLANQFSDIDLIVISPGFDKAITREDVKKLWRIAARTDCRIEPIPCGKLQWQNDQSSPILEIARNEGQKISI